MSCPLCGEEPGDGGPCEACTEALAALAEPRPGCLGRLLGLYRAPQ